MKTFIDLYSGFSNEAISLKFDHLILLPGILGSLIQQLAKDRQKWKNFVAALRASGHNGQWVSEWVGILINEYFRTSIFLTF